jgi:hypothetical protein
MFMGYLDLLKDHQKSSIFPIVSPRSEFLIGKINILGIPGDGFRVFPEPLVGLRTGKRVEASTIGEFKLILCVCIWMYRMYIKYVMLPCPLGIWLYGHVASGKLK